MPEASNVYRKMDVGMGSTPPGSHVFAFKYFLQTFKPAGFNKTINNPRLQIAAPDASVFLAFFVVSLCLKKMWSLW